MTQRFLKDRLDRRRAENAIRVLRDLSHLIDFSSNDYLGFARSPQLHALIQQATAKLAPSMVGATGSRLISGHSQLYAQVEAEIADFHHADSGLIFNSGYDANLGLLASVPRRGDTVIYDELSHASIRDGIRLGLAKAFSFHHNDLEHLEGRLKQTRGTRFVVVESVYSMDGDQAPLCNLVELCAKHDAQLIVDEAHATGVLGPHGEGLVADQKLTGQVFARVHTFGKALGVHGAIVLGSDMLKEYLVNFSRSFIYTTALPPHSLIAIQSAYQHLRQATTVIDRLHGKIQLFESLVRSGNGLQLLSSNSAIQGVVIPGNEAVRRVAGALQASGFDIRPILSPTVPPGKERIRICLHAFNHDQDICRLVEQLGLQIGNNSQTR